MDNFLPLKKDFEMDQYVFALVLGFINRRGNIIFIFTLTSA